MTIAPVMPRSPGIFLFVGSALCSLAVFSNAWELEVKPQSGSITEIFCLLEPDSCESLSGAVQASSVMLATIMAVQAACRLAEQASGLPGNGQIATLGRKLIRIRLACIHALLSDRALLLAAPLFLYSQPQTWGTACAFDASEVACHHVTQACSFSGSGLL